MIDVLILGGGIAGLAASHAARARGLSSVVLEAAPRAGGLLDNFTIDGFRFDNAVHLSFATEREVLDVFEQTPYLQHEAVSFCRDGDYWLRHPVQNNMHPLPVEQRVALIQGLVDQPDVAVIPDYRAWLLAQYGVPIAERWPLVYTDKYWTIDASEMGTDWIGQRMRRADLSEILRGAMSEDAPNTYYVKQMRYPERGGYRAFLDPLLAAADVRTGTRVERVDPGSRVVHSAEGQAWPYRHLVSTIPLPELIKITAGVPDSVQADASTLFATSVDLISIGLSRPHKMPSLWLYIYDRDVMAARIYSPSWKSPDNAPGGCSSMQFEIYSSPRRPQTASAVEMIENSIAAMVRMGLADRNDVVVKHHKRLPWGNVVYDLGMEERRDRVLAWVNAQGIASAGRFGEWSYLWSNQSFLSGLNAVGNLINSI
ncbi:NAD(P)-binding protein [Methylobacterium sp. 285MFTsu5.1]|uniref:protoporphyrinogen/coproporphyrinogen oxidase n=1 Tax=Methylobacterium sp. 285MFTsu5.1 TaxID=1172187 RepID=UPI000361C9E1|nr:NAD(P)-binding protein [Methylobacterium sp. 285MFTsu5.1]